MSLIRGMVRSWGTALLVIAMAVPAAAKGNPHRTTTTSTSTSSTTSSTSSSSSTSRPTTTSTSSSSTTSTSQPNTPPIANAGPDRVATVNVPITFNGSGSSDPGGSIAAYWWLFGDGGSSTTATPTVTWTYVTTGTRTLTLWVRDNAGVWSNASDTAIVTVGTGGGTTSTTAPAVSTTTSTSTTLSTSTSQPNQLPVANAGADQFAQTLTSLTFNGASSFDPDGTISLASWAFGDGGTAPGLTTSHSYAAAGTYTATLTVVDNKGASDTDTATVTVTNRPPVANAGPDLTGLPDSPVGLNGTASADPDGSIVAYSWAFGDGSNGAGATPSHAYDNPGTYTASLMVTDNHGANGSDAAVVTVNTTSTTWARAMGSTSSDAAYATTQDASGNTVVGGAYRGIVNFGGASLTSAGGADWFVAKYSPSGVLLWLRSMGGTGDDFLDALATDASGNVVASGRFSGTATFGGTALVANGTSDMAVAKYAAANGAHQWSKRFGGAYDDAPSAVAVDGSGNVYLTGYFRGTINFGGASLSVPFTTDLDVFVAKLDGAGGHVWSKNFTNSGNERGYGIAVDGSGNVAVAGYFSNTVNFGGQDLTSLNAMTDIFVARFTTAGAHSWSKRFGAPDGNESAYGVATDSTGNVLVTGYVLKAVDLGGGSLAALGMADAFVAKYAATSGAHQWSRRLGGGMNDYGYGVTVDKLTNNVFVAGSFEDTASFGGTGLTSAGSADGFVAKYGPTGTPLWAKRLGGTESDVPRGIDMKAGGVAVSGFFFGSGGFDGTTLTSAGLADAFVVRLAP